MKPIVDAEIEQMTKGGKYKWWNRQLTKHHYDSGKPFYLPDLDSPFMFQCLRCNAHFVMDECNNCANTEFEVGEGGGGLGIFCKMCESGISTWTCSDCGTKNPASRTFFILTKKGMCFIATAVYGSPLAPEVLVLKQYRDEILLRSSLGKAFVQTYYFVSPPLASLISKIEFLRTLTRILFLKPVLWIVDSECQIKRTKKTQDQLK